jgi:hypothetical protein
MHSPVIARVARVSIALVVLTSCAEQTSAASTPSGIVGTVVAGPTCPVERPESPCPDRPVGDARVTAKDDGTTKTTRSDASGAFRLRLKPGTYVVTATSDGLLGGCDEQPVRVAKRRYTRVTITCDTGIR